MRAAKHLDPTKRFYRGGLIDLSDFDLGPAALDESWDALVESSPDGSIFAHSTFLRACRVEVDAYLCRKNREVVAGVYLVVNRAERAAVLDKLVVYSGPIFAPPDPNQNRAQVQSDRFAISAFLVEALAKRYERLALRPPPSVNDLRAFLWHNYGTDGPKFRVDLRYTSVLDISSLAESDAPDASAVYRGLSKSRRQEIRYARRQELHTEERHDSALFRRLYHDTFRRQGIEPDPSGVDRVTTLVDDLVSAGTGRMFVCGPDGEPGAVAVFGIVKDRGYYLYGATDPAARSGHAGTAVLWDAMVRLARDGVRELDFEGVNSPARGYFKLSFGGEILPYYALRLDHA